MEESIFVLGKFGVYSKWEDPLEKKSDGDQL